MSGPVTTPELIQAYMDKTGLAQEECVQIVAKSASIRAMVHEYGDRFVLKGGTLLHHVYGGLRVSFKDADLAEKGGKYKEAEEVGELLTISEGEFHLKGNEGRWGWGDDLIEGLEIPVELGIETDLPRYKRLKVTVSLRESEQLDPPEEWLVYTDEMLAEAPRFEVNGLTLNELSAEKIIAWALRAAPKHYADLGLIGRDHMLGVDLDKVEEFTRKKVQTERQAETTRRSYDYAGVRNVADLARRFRSPELAKPLHQRNWEESLSADILFTAAEEDQARPFTDSKNVRAVVAEVWGPLLDRLERRR